jgi:hypothetical protein
VPTIPAGANPRTFLRRHRERGPKRFVFTYADLADLFGMTEGAVRQAVSRGKFDPHNLHSLCHFWATHHRDDDHVVVPLALIPASAEKPSLTIKNLHDTVEPATTVEEEPAVSGVSP